MAATMVSVSSCVYRHLIFLKSAPVALGMISMTTSERVLPVSSIRKICNVLRKHVHAIYRKCFGCKNENFHWKNFDIFLIFAKNIDCGLEPPLQN